MWHIQRTSDPCRLIEGVKFASFVGGGGKTTLIEHLARACLARQRSVAVTTTTKIFTAEPFTLFDDWVKGTRTAPFMHIGKSVEGGKLTGLNPDEVETLGSDFDVVLIEADGAKNRPLKYPAAYEPVIPSFSDRIFVIAGLDALFHPFKDVVFRHELFTSLTGSEPPRLVYPDVFIGLFSDDALLKGTAGLKRTIVLNKYDACPHRHLAAILMQKIMKQTGITKGLITALRHGVWYEMRTGAGS